jgi:hypothetical protein
VRLLVPLVFKNVKVDCFKLDRLKSNLWSKLKLSVDFSQSIRLIKVEILDSICIIFPNSDFIKKAYCFSTGDRLERILVILSEGDSE